MKLSKLITYKHMVDNLSVTHIYDELFTMLTELNTNLDIEKFDFDNIKQTIQTESGTIKNSLDVIDQDLREFKQHLSKFFDSIEQPYFEKSKQIYELASKDTADYILDQYRFKKLVYEEETEDFLRNRIKLYADWSVSACEIRPAIGDYTDGLVGCDPLYLVDTEEELFRDVKKMWNKAYQRRIRYYTIDETMKMPLGVLPQNQIGLFFSVNFFNFRTLQMIEKYLISMFSALRPGGVAIFTYNNCDYPIGVDNFEHEYYCYTPGRLVKFLCTKIGFKILASFDMENNVSWLEIQKPGRRTTLKGGQNLAKVEDLSKNTFGLKITNVDDDKSK